MSNPNKNKGNNFEREVAKIFTETLGTSFKKTPGSGSFIGGTNVHRIKKITDNQSLLHRGDIIPGDGYEHLIIECKARKGFLFHKLFTKCVELDKWIDQVEINVNDLSENKKDWFYCVIFKPNSCGLFICYPVLCSTTGDDTKNMMIYNKGDKHYFIEKFDEEWVRYHNEHDTKFRGNGNAKSSAN